MGGCRCEVLEARLGFLLGAFADGVEGTLGCAGCGADDWSSEMRFINAIGLLLRGGASPAGARTGAGGGGGSDSRLEEWECMPFERTGS